MQDTWRSLLLAVLVLVAPTAPALAEGAGKTAPPPARVAFHSALAASIAAQDVAQWVVRSRDNGELPFVIVDKTASRVFVFDASGTVLGASPALLGLARGDHTVAGIGDRAISSILPHERTTAAGRFAASMARSLKGEQILWVDYDSGLAMHRVMDVARERRFQRLASPEAADRRITYGCINLPAKFFEGVLLSAFAAGKGIVYVLPEMGPAAEVFAMQPRIEEETLGRQR